MKVSRTNSINSYVIFLANMTLINLNIETKNQIHSKQMHASVLQMHQFSNMFRVIKNLLISFLPLAN